VFWYAAGTLKVRFLCIARMDPLSLLYPSKYPDSYVDT